MYYFLKNKFLDPVQNKFFDPVQNKFLYPVQNKFFENRITIIMKPMTPKIF